MEQDVDEFVISDDGPVMCGEVARAALQRSIGKVFYHAGFEEFQPSALEAATDIATDYFQKIGKTLMVYKEAPQHERQFTPEVIHISPTAPQILDHELTLSKGNSPSCTLRKRRRRGIIAVLRAR